MRSLVFVLAVVGVALVRSAVSGQELPDLKVVRVEIVPNSVKDTDPENTFFRGRAILEAAPTPEKGGEKPKMQVSRSYRFIVTIHFGKGKAPSSVLVRTECVRDGKTKIIGKTRIALDDPSSQYACYDVFPGEAGPGDCVIRTVVVADSDNKALEFKAVILK